MMNFEKMKKVIILGLSSLAVVYIFILQLNSLNPFVASWDQVDFTLALERFDLRAMQPHFPGYPYFILGGMLLKYFVNEPNQALVLFNVLVYTSSILPVYFIGTRSLSRTNAILLAAVIYTASYPLIIVNQPMSEGAALAAFWWYFWSVTVAVARPAGKWMLLPLILFSVLLGIRLSYIPMGIGILYLLYEKYAKREIAFGRVIKYVIIAGLFQLIWVGGLVISEGGLTSFLELAFGFTGGHFQEWGGTSATNELSFLARLNAFLFTNILWWGMFSRTTVLMVLYIVIGIVLLLPEANRKDYKKISDQKEDTVKKEATFQKENAFNKTNTFQKKHLVEEKNTLRLGKLLLLAYSVWALFAQNIDKPRHILPLVLLLVFLGLIVFFKKRTGTFARLLIVLVIIAQAIISSSFIQKQAKNEPAVYQLAHYMEEQPEDFILYTWEETRILQYLGMSYPHKRIFTYRNFLHDQGLYKGKTVYLTNSVIDGFSSQGYDLGGNLEKVETFTSDEIFDPIYHEIILYKWTP
ncbi:glycosyltransferase family 39 protein [Mesobacillus selenatarsenatis]|nr:glycosyltransferase family 39 protein [Mesobacillus selenatarsenatis]